MRRRFCIFAKNRCKLFNCLLACPSSCFASSYWLYDVVRHVDSVSICHQVICSSSAQQVASLAPQIACANASDGEKSTRPLHRMPVHLEHTSGMTCARLIQAPTARPQRFTRGPGDFCQRLAQPSPPTEAEDPPCRCIALKHLSQQNKVCDVMCLDCAGGCARKNMAKCH